MVTDTAAFVVCGFFAKSTLQLMYYSLMRLIYDFHYVHNHIFSVAFDKEAQRLFYVTDTKKASQDLILIGSDVFEWKLTLDSQGKPTFFDSDGLSTRRYMSTLYSDVSTQTPRTLLGTPPPPVSERGAQLPRTDSITSDEN